MVAVNTCLNVCKTKKIRCPVCRGRICDLVIDEDISCRHKYKVISDEESKSNITIKCQKCGLIVGIAICQQDIKKNTIKSRYLVQVSSSLSK